MADEAEVQLTFTVKSSADAKYSISMTANSTVADLKTKLSTTDFADIPAERQRLIYSGRVLKDNETLASYKIKDGHTIHLVKGAESNSRQNPANQGTTASVGTQGSGGAAANVPSNLAAGTGAHNPLAALTGARYAGFHQLPGADMFGADGGMGAPPDPDQLLRLLENPNFAQQMNEAMNNPDVINMMRNNPMLRNNPMAQAVFDNPDMRRMLMNPDFIRMQMQMQRSMGGGAQNAFPAPGATDTTPDGQNQNQNREAGEGQQGQAQPPNPFGNLFGGMGAMGANPSGANPFAALFGGNPGAAAGSTPAATPPIGSAGQTGQNTPGQATSPPANTASQQQANPFASLFGAMGGAPGAGSLGGAQENNPIAEMTRQMMQNPDMMRTAMNMLGGMNGGTAGGAVPGAENAAANPFAAMGGLGGLGGLGGFGGFGGAPAQPSDSRPPEERYSEQLAQLNAMGFYEFDRNVRALRMSGGSVEGAVEVLLSGSI
ncbi:hypothetical protein BDV97DRAFT_377831 [Delphinella strobiligena]|nr:hypothetical protein BDV97DRAFT_377831 [Delphinella strobiligena]